MVQKMAINGEYGKAGGYGQIKEKTIVLNASDTPGSIYRYKWCRWTKCNIIRGEGCGGGGGGATFINKQHQCRS